jgi:hypothetical protein
MLCGNSHPGAEIAACQIGFDLAARASLMRTSIIRGLIFLEALMGLQEEYRDTRPEWCREAEKHSSCFVLVPPDERAVLCWGRGGTVMSRFEFTGPCSVAVITD